MQQFHMVCMCIYREYGFLNSMSSKMLISWNVNWFTCKHIISHQSVWPFTNVTWNLNERYCNLAGQTRCVDKTLNWLWVKALPYLIEIYVMRSTCVFKNFVLYFNRKITLARTISCIFCINFYLINDGRIRI